LRRKWLRESRRQQPLVLVLAQVLVLPQRLLASRCRRLPSLPPPQWLVHLQSCGCPR